MKTTYRLVRITPGKPEYGYGSRETSLTEAKRKARNISKNYGSQVTVEIRIESEKVVAIVSEGRITWQESLRAVHERMSNPDPLVPDEPIWSNPVDPVDGPVDLRGIPVVTDGTVKWDTPKELPRSRRGLDYAVHEGWGSRLMLLEIVRMELNARERAEAITTELKYGTISRDEAVRQIEELVIEAIQLTTDAIYESRRKASADSNQKPNQEIYKNTFEQLKTSAEIVEGRYSLPSMLLAVASILSDIHEFVGDNKEANLRLNAAKYCLFEIKSATRNHEIQF